MIVLFLFNDASRKPLRDVDVSSFELGRVDPDFSKQLFKTADYALISVAFGSSTQLHMAFNTLECATISFPSEDPPKSSDAVTVGSNTGKL